MPLPQTMVEKLDDFYNYMMTTQGMKPTEIDQSDIHHLFRLVKKQVKQAKENEKSNKGNKANNQSKETPKQGYLDQIPGW